MNPFLWQGGTATSCLWDSFTDYFFFTIFFLRGGGSSINNALTVAQAQCGVTQRRSRPAPGEPRQLEALLFSLHVFQCLLLGGARVYGVSGNPHPSFSSHLSLALRTSRSPRRTAPSQCAQLVRHRRRGRSFWDSNNFNSPRLYTISHWLLLILFICFIFVFWRSTSSSTC